MQVVNTKTIPGIPGPYEGIMHYFIANHDNGFHKFEILYSELGKGMIGYMHSHPHSEKMQLVLEGALKFVTPDKKEYDVPAGSAMLFHPGEMHEVYNTYDGITKYMIVYADPR